MSTDSGSYLGQIAAPKDYGPLTDGNRAFREAFSKESKKQHRGPPGLRHWADIPPSRVTGKLAAAEGLALSRWVTDGWVGSRRTRYHQQLLTWDQLQPIGPWLSPCQQGPTLHQKYRPLARAPALQPGAQALPLVQRLHSTKPPSAPGLLLAFRFKLLVVTNESHLLPHQY